MQAPRLNNFSDLLVRHTEHLYDAELRLVQLLLTVKQHVQTAAITDALEDYRRETHTSINRLRKVFLALGMEPRRAQCGTVKEAVASCEDLVRVPGDQGVKETALLAVIQGIQNYEIAFYRTAYCLAKQLALPKAATLLKRSLEVETDGDMQLAAFIRRSRHLHDQPQ